MTGFKRGADSTQGWSSWEGDPDDNAAHQTILEWLLEGAPGGFRNQNAPLPNAVKGNLGEFIAYRIGESYVFTDGTSAYTANASDPLSEISRPDIDIVWLHFGDAESDAWAALQEVKTTGDVSLRLADDLSADYDKLFGENVRLTLPTRLGALKNRLDQLGQANLSPRLTALGGPSPDRSRGIRLIPTLIHDKAHDSASKMAVVRQILMGKGWSSDVVECWSVALAELDDRLARLARGQP